MKQLVVSCLSALLLAACSSPPAYLDPTLSPAERATDLVSRMSLDEKIGQLMCPYGWEMYQRQGDSVLLTDHFQQMVSTHHIGMLWGTFRADPWTRKDLTTGLTPDMAVRLANRMQRYAIENSRWGIPLFLAEEAPHGFMSIGATVFPTALGQASTWNPQLIRTMAGVIASELRSQGAHIAYGPVLDIAREPRWSRVEECYGEDVCLTSAMGSAFVEGLGSYDLSQPLHALSTLKHFVAYGVSEGGQNGGSNLLGERELRRTHLPAVHAAIRAGARSVMTAYSSTDGIPCTANEYLLREVLRKEWGFEGFTISDLYSIEGLCNAHKIVESIPQAAITAMQSGVDADLCGEAYATLAESVRNGKLSEELIDRAAENVLRQKFEMGLFEHPYLCEQTPTAGSQEHRQTALEVARESVILLENRGVLPLSKQLTKVAVIGPNADNRYNQLGDYTAQQDSSVITLRKGIERLLGHDRVIYAKGCAIRDQKSAQIEQACQAARQADVAVVVVGGSSARDFDTQYLATGAAVASTAVMNDMECGEGNDRATLSLMGQQEELLKAVKATGKPLIVIYIEGRPLNMNWAAEYADALLLAWYPGQGGGTALTEVLFGDYNPAGRLPISIPRSEGQLPIYYSRLAPANHDYVDGPAKPCYAFGYGRSYTRFAYSDLQIEKQKKNQFKVSCTVENTGEIAGDEVVQLYLHPITSSVVQPLLELKGFSRVSIAPHQKQLVEFILTPDDLSIIDRRMQSIIEPGEVEVMIGASSDNMLLHQTLKTE